MLHRRVPRRSAHQSAFRLELVASREPGLRVVVSSKVAKLATRRNLLKRRLREIWRHLPHRPPGQLTVYTKKAALDMSFQELAAQLSSGLTQL